MSEGRELRKAKVARNSMQCVGDKEQLEFLVNKKQDREWRDEGRRVGRDQSWRCLYSILKR